MNALTRRPRTLRVAILLCAAVAVVVPLVAGTVGSAGAGSEPPVAPAVQATAYPYEIASRVGPWGFPTRHSTDYVAWRLYERDVDFNKGMRGPNGQSGEFGDAGTWAANALKIGLKVDQSPKPGSIAHWTAGEQGARGTGHVAFVEQVNADGTVLLSEFDWSVANGYSMRGQPGSVPVRAPRYIHVNAR